MAEDCPKCAGRMAQGFLVDNTYGSASPVRWYTGLPRRSFWTGLKLKGVEQHEVVTWRCGRCGYLENYAPG